MRFFEFNKYEYYALILADTEEIAKIGYKQEIADIEEEEKNLHPDIISTEEALKRYKKAIVDGCETEEDKIEDFYKQLNNFNKYVNKGSERYLVFLVDGSLY